jgi:hypothetical protein
MLSLYLRVRQAMTFGKGVSDMDPYSKMNAWSAMLTAVGTILLVLTGLGAMLFAWVQIRSERAYRRVENIEREIEKFDGGRCAKAREIFATSRLAVMDGAKPLGRDNAPAGAYEILNFFEHLGHLAKAGHLEVRAVWHTFGWWILMMNFDLRSLVAEERQKSKTVFCDFEWLVKKVSRIELREEGCDLEITQERLIDFYRDELGNDQKIKTVRAFPPRKSSSIKRAAKQAHTATAE